MEMTAKYSPSFALSAPPSIAVGVHMCMRTCLYRCVRLWQWPYILHMCVAQHVPSLQKYSSTSHLSFMPFNSLAPSIIWINSEGQTQTLPCRKCGESYPPQAFSEGTQFPGRGCAREMERSLACARCVCTVIKRAPPVHMLFAICRHAYYAGNLHSCME